jgi:hypothetical protein
VEEQPGVGTLAFVAHSGKPAGLVVSCEGKICLVRGVGGVTRFSDLLASRYPRSSEALSDAVKTARSEGRLVGEVLAELGHISLEHIRDCLRDQVTAGLMALAGSANVSRKPAFSPLEKQHRSGRPQDALGSIAELADRCAGANERINGWLLHQRSITGQSL